HGKLDYRQTLDYLPAQPAISVTRLYLDGNDYSTDFTGHLRFADVFGEDNLTVSLEAAHISGGADYSYLDGFRLRAMTAKIWLGDGYRFTLDYRLQYDQRDDLREDDIRIIESGREQRIRAELAFTVGSRTDLSLFGHYRHARKDDDSRLQDLDGSVRQLTRTTTGFTAGVEADYQLHRAATLSAEARYESTDDSYELYRHDRLTLTVSASYRF
ncbi:MAG: hypothetical protein R3208_22855, partial [Ketobacteraceae bacterium]|nr:hypothetical protein [Ketobacteraceae bacterium]